MLVCWLPNTQDTAWPLAGAQEASRERRLKRAPIVRKQVYETAALGMTPDVGLAQRRCTRERNGMNE